MNQFALHSQFNTMGGYPLYNGWSVQPGWKTLTLPQPRFALLPRQHWLVLDLLSGYGCGEPQNLYKFRTRMFCMAQPRIYFDAAITGNDTSAL